MSIAEFGSNVEEVQRKLNELLPLVDAGANRADDLHEQIADEMADYETSFEGLESSLTDFNEAATA